MTLGESAAKRVLAMSELVLDALPRAIVIADLDGTILACNQVATRTYGLSAGGAVGRPISDFFSGSSADDVRLVVDLVRRGQTWAGDVPVARADGRTSWTYASVGPLRDENGVVVGIVGSADDAQSEVRMLQRQASELSERLVLALAAGELGTWHRDMVTGLTEWDATLERIYGLAPGEFDGRYETFLELIHPEDVDRTREAVERAVANKSAYEVEHRVIWPDGTVHWVQGRGTITLGADGDVTGTIGCASDITARKRLEIEATRRYSQAEEAIRRERVLRERLEFLAELNRVAFAAPDYRSLMRAVTAAAVPELGDWCTLHFLPEPGGGAPEVEVAHRDPSKVEWAAQVRQRFPYDPDSPRGVPAVIRTGRLEFLREVDRESIEAAIVEAGASAIREELLALLDVLQLTSVITVPLNTKRRTIGAMQFVSAESGRVYDNEDVVLAQTAASRIAEALDNVWLTGQLREIASKLQASLLPPRLPQVPGISIAARYWAAGAMSEVGGDFYDAFAIDDHRWAVVIGDVCGTGPDGAAVTAIARHTIRAAATHGHPPEVVLSWLNDALHAGNRDLFCTVAYVTLEPFDGGRWRFTSTSAGHPFPVQVRRSGDATSVGIPGMLLGAIDSVTVHPVDGVLDVGDTLVLYTDGVTDVSPPYGIEPDELEKMAADAAAGEQSAESIAARFGDAIEEVLPISEREDDVALVVVHVI